jgi:mannose-6-phosphate isomerase-like protein (cupin superfamily)
MAIYILDVAETEEHSHDQETMTVLLEGAADLIIEDRRRPLAINEIVRVPAHTPHLVINTGPTLAKINCHC